MSGEKEKKTRRLRVSVTAPTVIDGSGEKPSGRQTSQLPLEAPAEPEPPAPVEHRDRSLPGGSPSVGDTSIVSAEELGTETTPGYGEPVATGPGATPRAPSPARSRAWIALLLAGLLGLGAGAAAGTWMPREVVAPKVVAMAPGELVDHHGWTIRLISQGRQQGARGTFLLVRLGVQRQRGSTADAGRYFLLDVGPVTRVPAFWSSSSGGELKIAFPLLAKQKARLGLRFWHPGTPPLIMRLGPSS